MHVKKHTNFIALQSSTERSLRIMAEKGNHALAALNEKIVELERINTYLRAEREELIGLAYLALTDNPETTRTFKDAYALAFAERDARVAELTIAKQEHARLLTEHEHLQRGAHTFIKITDQHLKEIEALTVKLTLANQHWADTSYELRYAKHVLEHDSSNGSPLATAWLAWYAGRTNGPLPRLQNGPTEQRLHEAEIIFSLLQRPGQQVPDELHTLFCNWQSHDEGLDFQHFLARRWLLGFPFADQGTSFHCEGELSENPDPRS